MTKKYFVDKNHSVMTEYYDFLNLEERASAKTEKKMKKFIQEDPQFFDPYLILFELYKNEGDLEKAEKILEQAFKKAIEKITDKKGNWPKEMSWTYLENRHIIRTLLNKALNLWVKGKNEEALKLLRKLLRSNPRDNIGARHYILAIHLGMKFDEFENQMMSEYGYGYDGMKMIEFEEKMKNFPDEFDWWFEAIKEDEEN
jgi:tetratricopeptide (TPR) repeat protein